MLKEKTEIEKKIDAYCNSFGDYCDECEYYNNGCRERAAYEIGKNEISDLVFAELQKRLNNYKPPLYLPRSEIYITKTIAEVLR